MLKTYLVRCGVFLAFLLFSEMEGKGQVTFNNRIEVDGVLASVITNIEPTDSCYFVCGVMADSTGAPGSFFGKLDLVGKLIEFKPLIPDTLFFQLWYNTLIKKGNLFHAAGIGYLGGGRRSCYVVFNQLGEVEFFKWIDLPDHPFASPSPQSMVTFEDGWLLIESFSNYERNRFEARILKLDNNGSIIWEKIYSDPEYSFRPKIIVIDSQSILIGGGKGNVDYRLQNYHEQTVILNYNHQGELNWKFESPHGWSSAEGIVSTPDGGYIIGAKRGISRKVNQTVDVFQIEHLIFKLDSNHNLEWSRLMRDHRMHEFNNLEKLIDVGDGIVYCGHLNAEVTGFQGTIGKVSYTGDSLWLRSFIFESDTVVSYNHMLYDLETTNDNGLISVGQTNDNTLDQYGWVIKLDKYGCLIPGCQLSNTKDISGEPGLDLSIFPNPTSDYLNFLIKAPSHDNLEYKIVNNEGKVMSQNTGVKPNVTYIVPVHSCASSTYHLQIFSGGKLLGVKSFVKN